jgi:hypothetical protein
VRRARGFDGRSFFQERTKEVCAGGHLTRILRRKISRNPSRAFAHFLPWLRGFLSHKRHTLIFSRRIPLKDAAVKIVRRMIEKSRWSVSGVLDDRMII